VSDIIERLAELSDLMMNDRPYNDSDFTDIDEAIDEIKRLRNELTERINMCDMRSEKILELTNERDEARREILLWVKERCSWAELSQEIEKRGWDCHKDYK
jgi:hypothetical protein